MGRKTFETIGKPLKGRRTIVLTRTIPAHPIEGVEYTSETPLALVSRLEKEGVSQLAVIGGSSVYGQYLVAGLVHELYLTVEPVLFGDGVPLASGFERTALILADVTRLGEQAVLLHYLVRR